MNSLLAIAEELPSFPEVYTSQELLYATLYLTLHGAHKSGATLVKITYDDHCGYLRVEDNGVFEIRLEDIETIHDRVSQGLLSIARWSPHLFRLAGALVASEDVKIFAGPSALHLQTEDFIASGQMTVVTSISSVDTAIVLFSLKDECRWSTSEVRRTLQSITRGYSPTVLFNGDTIGSPNALDDTYRDFSLGHYDLSEVSRSEGERPYIFLDGLPIRLGEAESCLPGGISVHLNCEMIPFQAEAAYGRQGRMANHCELICSEIDAVWSSFLENKRFLLDDKQFSWKYSQSCLRTGKAALLNDLPLHPSFWGTYTRLPGPDDHATTGQFTHGNGLLSPERRLLKDVDWSQCGSKSLVASYIYALGMPVLKSDLDCGHWAVIKAVDINQVKLVASSNVVAGTRKVIRGMLQGTTVVFCRQYTISPGAHGLPTIVIDDAPTFCCETQTVYVTPKSHRDLHTLLWQIAADRENALECYSEIVLEATKSIINLMGRYFH